VNSVFLAHCSLFMSRGHIIPPGVSEISLTSRFEKMPHMTSLVGVST
jgi:hypothetical protein